MGFRPALFFLGLSCTCSKIGRNYDHGTVSSNFINRVFLLSNFWYRCSSSPTFFSSMAIQPQLLLSLYSHLASYLLNVSRCPTYLFGCDSFNKTRSGTETGIGRGGGVVEQRALTTCLIKGIPLEYKARWLGLCSCCRWNCQYSSQSPLMYKEPRGKTASAPLIVHLAPVISILSVFNQVSTSTLNHPRGDGESSF